MTNMTFSYEQVSTTINTEYLRFRSMLLPILSNNLARQAVNRKTELTVYAIARILSFYRERFYKFILIPPIVWGRKKTRLLVFGFAPDENIKHVEKMELRSWLFINFKLS